MDDDKCINCHQDKTRGRCIRCGGFLCGCEHKCELKGKEDVHEPTSESSPQKSEAG